VNGFRRIASVLGVMLLIGACSAAPQAATAPPDAPSAPPTDPTQPGVRFGLPIQLLNTARIQNPDLSITLPQGWWLDPAEAVEADRQRILTSTTGEANAIVRELVAKFANSETFRLHASGPSGIQNVNDTLGIDVTTGTVEERMALESRLVGLIGTAPTIDKAAVRTRVGDGTRFDIVSAPPPDRSGAIASRTVVYALRLADGRLLWLVALGPRDSLTFPVLADATFRSVRD
jgi:hypothetical protein